MNGHKAVQSLALYSFSLFSDYLGGSLLQAEIDNFWTMCYN